MAEPLALVPALNTMIPLCALLAFGASVSHSPWVVKAVSRTVLIALITLAWLSQPASKIQNLVSQLWGQDTPTLVMTLGHLLLTTLLVIFSKILLRFSPFSFQARKSLDQKIEPFLEEPSTSFGE